MQGKTRTPRGADAGLPLPWVRGRLASPREDTWRLGCLPLQWVRPEHHVVLGLACPCLGQESGPRPPMRIPGTWVVCPSAGSDSSATWR
ncbi:hypothetical protein Peur_013138 [Populus x canadensis]